MRTALLLSTIVSSLIFSFISCGGLSKVVPPKMNTAIIPAGFNPATHILLIAEMPRAHSPQRHDGITKKLDKIFLEKYPYKYEIVSLQQIHERSGKYADTTIYKYAVLNNLSQYQRTTTTTITRTSNTGTSVTTLSPTATITSIDFRFYERTTDKAYPLSGNSSTSLKYSAGAFVDIINEAIKRK